MKKVSGVDFKTELVERRAGDPHTLYTNNSIAKEYVGR